MAIDGRPAAIGAPVGGPGVARVRECRRHRRQRGLRPGFCCQTAGRKQLLYGKAAMPTNPAVDEWFANYEHPLKAAMLRVREIVLEEPRMAEAIKMEDADVHLPRQPGELQPSDEVPHQPDVPQRRLDTGQPPPARRERRGGAVAEADQRRRRRERSTRSARDSRRVVRPTRLTGKGEKRARAERPSARQLERVVPYVW